MPFKDPIKQKQSQQATDQRIYQAKKRKREQEGACTTCGGVRDEPPLKKCKACRARMVEYKKHLQDPSHPFEFRPRGHPRVPKDPSICRKPTCQNPRDDKTKKLCTPCNLVWSSRAKLNRDAWKKTVFDHYGWACKCCGETLKSFLSIDHVNGGGSKHLGTNGRRLLGSFLYRWLIKNGFPEDFQTLCINCNFSKGHSPDGKCEHEREREGGV